MTDDHSDMPDGASGETPLQTAAIDAALTLASEKDWEEVTLSQIAQAAGKPLDAFYGEIDRGTLVDLIDQRLDRACSSEAADLETSLRERVFEAAMLRFEAMEDHRSALLSIRRSWKDAPAARLAAARRRGRTAKWVLTCAGEDGPGLTARSALLTGILTRAETAWERDAHGDFTRTMSTLDRDLRRVGDWAKQVKSVLGGLGGLRKRGGETTDAPETPVSEPDLPARPALES